MSRHLHLEEWAFADNQSLFTLTFARTLSNLLVQDRIYNAASNMVWYVSLLTQTVFPKRSLFFSSRLWAPLPDLRAKTAGFKNRALSLTHPSPSGWTSYRVGSPHICFYIVLLWRFSFKGLKREYNTSIVVIQVSEVWDTVFMGCVR